MQKHPLRSAPGRTRSRAPARLPRLPALSSYATVRGIRFESYEHVCPWSRQGFLATPIAGKSFKTNNPMPTSMKYSGLVGEMLDRANAQLGDVIEVRRGSGVRAGILLPHHDLSGARDI